MEKNDCADDEINEYAKKLKVCGHPLRLKLLCLIERNQEPCVMQLWTCLKQSQPVISQHLAILKDNDIVKAEVQGNKRVYSIIAPFIKSLVSSFGEATINPEG